MKAKRVLTKNRIIIFEKNTTLIKGIKADNNYQVEEYITKAEFEKVFKEIQEYGRSGKVKSVSGKR